MKIQDLPIYAESWNIAIRPKARGSILADTQTAFVVQRNPFRYWIADPLVFQKDKRTYLFAEMYDYVRCRGIIGVAEYADGKLSQWQPVLVEPFHLSYPMVFQMGDAVYMIPETGAVRELRLYKAVQFPQQWEFVSALVKDRNLADTTLLDQGEVLVGFTQDQAGINLRIRIRKDIWEASLEPEAHQDLAHYRPGGHIFRHGEHEIRVCQDCEADYGAALIFREYRNLMDADAVREHRITPQMLRYSTPILAQGIHTYSATEAIEVVDIKTRRLNPLNLCFRIVSKWKGR